MDILKPTLDEPKFPVQSGLDLDPTLYYELAREYECVWRSISAEYNVKLLRDAGILGVLIFDGKKYTFEFILQMMLADIKSMEQAESLLMRPAIRISLQGQQHTYHFYAMASTVREALDNFIAARVMCS